MPWVNLLHRDGGIATWGSGWGYPAAVTTLAACFTNPAGVSVDAAGNVYVADISDGVKEIVAATGVVSTLGSGFITPARIAVDANGRVYVVGYDDSRLSVFTP